MQPRRTHMRFRARNGLEAHTFIAARGRRFASNSPRRSRRGAGHPSRGRAKLDAQVWTDLDVARTVWGLVSVWDRRRPVTTRRARLSLSARAPTTIPDAPGTR